MVKPTNEELVALSNELVSAIGKVDFYLPYDVVLVLSVKRPETVGKYGTTLVTTMEDKELAFAALVNATKDLLRMIEAEKAERVKNCSHSEVLPFFDEKAAEGLSPEEVRKRWPRTDYVCSKCGVQVVGYASKKHYIAGDW